MLRNLKPVKSVFNVTYSSAMLSVAASTNFCGAKIETSVVRTYASGCGNSCNSKLVVRNSAHVNYLYYKDSCIRAYYTGYSMHRGRLENATCNSNPSYENSLPFSTRPKKTSPRLPLKRKSPLFIERSVLFLRTSPLYKETTIRPNNKCLSNAEEKVHSLTDETKSCQLSVDCSHKNYFSPKEYIKNFHAFLVGIGNPNEARVLFSRGEANVQKFSKLELQDLLVEIAMHKSKLFNIKHFLQVLDLECSRRAHMWDVNSCLLCLDFWYMVDRHRFTSRKFWKIMLQEWECKDATEWTLQSLVQFLFYMGVAKSAPHTLLAKLESSLDGRINMAVSEELGIVCDGFYKNKYQVSPSILAVVETEVTQLMSLDIIDRFSVIRLLKVLRHAQHISDDLCFRLITLLNTGLLAECNLTECAHFAATVASARNKLPDSLETTFLKVLESENGILTDRQPNFHKHPSEKSRPKDVARILWSLAETSHQVQNNDFSKIVVRHLELCLQSGYFDQEPHVLLDSLVSLAILDIYPFKLINYIFSPDIFELLCNMNRDKPSKQLHTLSQIVAFGCSNYTGKRMMPQTSLAATPNLRELEDEVQSRPELYEFGEILKGLVNDGATVKPIRALPYIGIAGFVFKLNLDGHSSSISLSSLVSGNQTTCSLNDAIIDDLLGHKRSNLSGSSSSVNTIQETSPLLIAIELLDPTTCIKGTDTPTGLMKVKIQHLKILKYKVLVIYPQELKPIWAGENISRTKVVKEILVQFIERIS